MGSLDAQQARERTTSERAKRLAWTELVKRLGCRYQNCTLEGYKIYAPAQRDVVDAVRSYGDRLPELVRAGQGLLLFGSVGTGKDHLMAYLMRRAVAEHGFLSLSWINGIDWYGANRDRIDEGRSEAEAVRLLTLPAIVAISDPVPSWSTMRPYQIEMLYRVLDGRARQCRATWLTMNIADGAQAQEQLGGQIVSRLRQDCQAVACFWPDYRSRKGD